MLNLDACACITMGHSTVDKTKLFLKEKKGVYGVVLFLQNIVIFVKDRDIARRDPSRRWRSRDPSSFFFRFWNLTRPWSAFTCLFQLYLSHYLTHPYTAHSESFLTCNLFIENILSRSYDLHFEYR